MEKKLKVVFVGVPDMALVCLNNLLERGFNIVGVVPPKKDHDTYNYFKKFVENKNLNFIEFDGSANSNECVEKVKALEADIGVVCSYNNLLKKDFLSTTKMGYINCHPSLLPYYRGAAPYFHIVNNGEKVSGITLHFMDESFDTGDIVFQQKFDVAPFETMGSIFNRTTYMLSDALIDVLTKLEHGIELKRIPQTKDKDFIKAPRVDGNFRIRWHHDCFELERLVRACNPFYNAFSTFRGVSIKVIKARAVNIKHSFDYGQIIRSDENCTLIAARNGCLALDIVQVGTWGVFNPQDFYYTFTPNIGEVLA